MPGFSQGFNLDMFVTFYDQPVCQHYPEHTFSAKEGIEQTDLVNKIQSTNIYGQGADVQHTLFRHNRRRLEKGVIKFKNKQSFFVK